MTQPPQMKGVFVAAVTPLKADLCPDLAAIPPLLDFYAKRGAHGALLLGTTGEGPSFSQQEREAIFTAGAEIKTSWPDFKLLAGTGTPSLDATIQLNKTAFDIGFDGVVTLPPYYFRTVTEEGLFAWFSLVIDSSVPSDGCLLGYHFPQISGVPLSQSLLTQLADKYPVRFGGIKDSSGDLNHTQNAVRALPEQSILIGNDRLMTAGLQAGSSGCITAAANLISPQLRKVYDDFHIRENTSATQAIVNAARDVLETLMPFPAALKGLLSELFGFPRWPLKPPLVPFREAEINAAAGKLAEILE
ncbi:MAG: dihydrodipicolinate synthase family protein [Anaerolineales bacterium]|nr:dihydrodipicolinate synthase family protein [Anaerolineales bacterium]